MTLPKNTVLLNVAAGVIARRAGSGADALAVATAARRAYDDLAGALAPLISKTGVEALLARALHLDNATIRRTLREKNRLPSRLVRPFSGWRRLGLAIVKHIVELHSGSVVAASEGEGKGATFTVRIPCAE